MILVLLRVWKFGENPVLSPIDSSFKYVSFSKDGFSIICEEAESIFGKLLLTNDA